MITWTASGSLKTTGSLSGSFDFDGTSFSNWSFSFLTENMSSTDAGVSAAFTNPVSIAGIPSVVSTLVFTDGSDVVSLGLTYASESIFGSAANLSFVDGSSGLNFASYVTDGATTKGFKAPGTLTGIADADPTPEPDTWALLGTGALLLLGLAWRRRGALASYTGM